MQNYMITYITWVIIVYSSLYFTEVTSADNIQKVNFLSLGLALVNNPIWSEIILKDNIGGKVYFLFF